MILRVWDVTFTVSDLGRAVDFYEHVLKLPKKYQFSTYAGFDCGRVEIGLVPGDMPAEQEGTPCVDFLVQDVDEAYQTLRERGVRFPKEPHDTAWSGCIALFTNLDGSVLQLVQIDWPKYFAVCEVSPCPMNPREFPPEKTPVGVLGTVGAAATSSVTSGRGTDTFIGFLNTLLQPTMSSTGVVRGQNDGLCKAWQGNL